MIKLFREHEEFGGFGKFDTNNGQLSQITESEFNSLRKLEIPTYFNNNFNHTIFPRRIYFQITRYCDLMCDYCFIRADKSQKHLDTNTIFNLADYFGRQGLMEVRLTGGEPTLHPDFEKIYEKFRENNIYVSVATNGIWNKKTLEYLGKQRNIWLIISIDGSRHIHNRFRKNSYDKIVKNILNLKSVNPECRIRINTVLTQENYKETEHLALLTRQFDAESITLIPLRPQVRNRNVTNKMLRPEQFKQVIIEMIGLKEKYGIKFTTTIETEFKEKIMPDKIFRKKSSCAAGREGTNLDFDFETKKLFLYGCSYCPASDLKELPKVRQPFVAGELNYNEIGKIKEIWDNDSNWTVFRNLDLKSNNCKNCNELGNRCTGSCPIQNIDLTNVNFESNLISQLAEQMQQNAEWYCYKGLNI